MASQNDIVWLALHAGELTRQQLDALDLSMLRSFEPRGMGYSVEMFKAADCERGGETEGKGTGFIEALYSSAEKFYGHGCPHFEDGKCSSEKGS